MTLDELEPYYIYVTYVVYDANLEKRAVLPTAKIAYRAGILDSSNIRFMRIFTRFSRNGAANDSGVLGWSKTAIFIFLTLCNFGTFSDNIRIVMRLYAVLHCLFIDPEIDLEWPFYVKLWSRTDIYSVRTLHLSEPASSI